MKLLVVFIALLAAIPAFAQNLTIDMKLAEVNPDSTQARFFKGEAAYGLSDAFASVTCWGSEGNRINIEVEKTGKQYSAEFASYDECKSLIKKAKGFLGVNYGTIRFTIKGKKVLFERI